jgi:hypothetical protein
MYLYHKNAGCLRRPWNTRVSSMLELQRKEGMVEQYAPGWWNLRLGIQPQRDRRPFGIENQSWMYTSGYESWFVCGFLNKGGRHCNPRTYLSLRTVSVCHSKEELLKPTQYNVLSYLNMAKILKRSKKPPAWGRTHPRWESFEVNYQ